MFRKIYFISIAALTLIISGCSIINNKSTQTATPSPCLVFVSSHPEWPGVPCPPTNLSTVTTTPDIFTASSTSFVPSTPSFIDQNNPATWPHFTFKELGFSLKLPFDKEMVRSELRTCINKKATQFINGKKSSLMDKNCEFAPADYQWFTASTKTAGDSDFFYPFLSAHSAFVFIHDGSEIGATELLYDFYQKGAMYHFVPVPNLFTIDFYSPDDDRPSARIFNLGKIPEFDMHAVSVANRQGHTIVMYDSFCDYDNGRMEEKRACMADSADYQVIIKISNNKYFKAASLQYIMPRQKLSLDKIKIIMDSIIFFK